MYLDSFKKVVRNYRAVFFDAFGVLKNASGILPQVQETFTYLQENNIAFYVLTNDASRSPLQLADFYQSKGINDITADKIISSGMLARDYLRHKVKDGRVAYLGTKDSAVYLEALELMTIPISKLDLNHRKMDEIRALVLLDDEGFDWQLDLNKTINLLRRTNVPVVVANTDKTYPVSENQVAAAIGSIADLLEWIVGKTFIRFGKPDAQMFHFAFEHIKQENDYQKDDVLMVGDTLHTDILGGNKFGIDTVLVLSGNTIPDQAEFYIKTTGIIPDFICESITT
ncbi:MAG: HAD-IIA family hydrolase [Saprospiraceae bacterium]|nr:HAD-IIA family hydrolase [Saprospiraceae bacterium]